MTLYQFILLDYSEQTKIIAQHAVYLNERIDGDYTYKLYQIDKFYIEERWHTKFNERRSFDSFNSEEKLKPYLKFID
ncbi:MAG TPA: hypothetical protein VGI61_13035, partial [Parafilimonas sp.]